MGANKTGAKIIEQKVVDLVPGIELARDVCSNDGKVLVSQGTVLNKQAIQKLRTWEVDKVFTYQETSVNLFADPHLRQFIETYNKSVTVVERAFADIRRTQEVPLAVLSDTAQGITDTIATAGNVIDQLYNLPHCDDYTYFHSVNVSVISSLIAQWMKIPADNISAIAMAGLLHDIGKSQLPPELLNRPDSLPPDQYLQYKQHVRHGYELVSKLPDLAHSIKDAVLQHHERCNGSGYPSALCGDDIHPYAKIVAVADIYDEALTINRNPDIILSPYTALEKVRDQLHLVDARIALTLIDNMVNFLSGNRIVLNNSRIGRVVCVNKDQPSRSMVQLDDGCVVDLSETTIRINYILR